MNCKDEDVFNALWIGSSLSSLELLAISSFLHHGHVFRLWTYEPISTRLPAGTIVADANKIIDRRKVFRYAAGANKGSYAGFSDIFRAKLLYEIGGWYVDTDVICLKPITLDAPYVFRGHYHLPLVGNIIRCPRDAELMRWYFESVAQVDEFNTDWEKPIRFLCEGVEKFRLQQYIRNDISNSDHWDDVASRVYGGRAFEPQWFCFHWCNEYLRLRGINKESPPWFSCLRTAMQELHVPTKHPGLHSTFLQLRYQLRRAWKTLAK